MALALIVLEENMSLGDLHVPILVCPSLGGLGAEWVALSWTEVVNLDDDAVSAFQGVAGRIGLGSELVATSSISSDRR